MMTLFRHFDTGNDGQITYLEFCAAIQDSNPFESTQDETGYNPTEKFVASSMTDSQIDAYVNLTNEKKLTGRKEIQCEEALNKLVAFTQSHRDAHHTANLFRDFDEDHSGTLGLAEFREVLGTKIHLGKRDIDLILDKFFPPGVSSLHYENFLRALQTYTDAKKKGKFLGNGYKPPSLKGKGNDMASLLFG